MENMSLEQLINFGYEEYSIEDQDLPDLERNQSGDLKNSKKNRSLMIERIKESESCL